MSENEETAETRESPMDLYVLQPGNGKPNDSNATATTRQWGGGPWWMGGVQMWTVIYDVVDLVRHVKAKCGDKFYIGTLRIGGHGNTDRFRLGNTLISNAPLNDNGTLITSVFINDLKPWLKEIIPYFKTGKSYIVLETCLVGQNDSLLKNLSEAFGGTPVIAPFDLQGNSEGDGSPPLLEGQARACYPDRCFILNNPKDLMF